MGCIQDSDKKEIISININKQEVDNIYEKYKILLHHISKNNSTTLFQENKYNLGKVLDVYDGDTVTISIIINRQNYNFKCRLNRIDCPELRCLKIQNNRDLEIKAALKVKQYLTNILLNRIIKFEFIKIDKYGRLLIELYLLDNTNISDILLNNKYAKFYNGKTKSRFNDYELNNIIQ
jgi:endonuclease YncB( thermonuclease family)